METEEGFKKGATVEVSSDEPGLRGSWFTATVLRTTSKRNKKILVEYHTLVTARDRKKPLREFVNVVLVRPLAPRDTPGLRCFRLDDDVDAFYNDGWWEGIVTAILPACRYSVFFRYSREQLDFHRTDLRLHREWVHGGWIPPPEGSDHSGGEKMEENGREEED